MSDRNYLAEIEEIDRQHKELMEKRKSIIDEWVEAEHPLKVGDVVNPVGSYSYKQMRVAERSVDLNFRSKYWPYPQERRNYRFDARGVVAEDYEGGSKCPLTETPYSGWPRSSNRLNASRLSSRVGRKEW